MCFWQLLAEASKTLPLERVLLAQYTKEEGRPLRELHPFPFAASPGPAGHRKKGAKPYYEQPGSDHLPRWLVRLQSGQEAVEGLLGLVEARRSNPALGQPLGVCWGRVDVVPSRPPGADKEGAAGGQAGEGESLLPGGGISVWVLELVVEHRG
jgi:hypothetical protein